MDNKERNKLIEDLIELCKLNGLDESFIDFQHEIDIELSFSENKRILMEAYNLKYEDSLIKDYRETEAKTNYERWQISHLEGFNVFKLRKPYVVAVIGKQGSGKTALVHSVVDELRSLYKLPIFAFRYPREELLQRIGYQNLKDISQVETLQDSILWLDEPQLSLPKYEKRNNDTFEQVMTICRQRDIILVVSTNDSRWINKRLESYVDIWMIKNIDFQTLKRGSIAKQIIKKNATFSPDSFKLENNQYLLYIQEEIDFQGKFENTLPKYWSEEYSKPYRIPIATANAKSNCEVKNEKMSYL